MPLLGLLPGVVRTSQQGLQIRSAPEPSTVAGWCQAPQVWVPVHQDQHFLGCIASPSTLPVEGTLAVWAGAQLSCVAVPQKG